MPKERLDTHTLRFLFYLESIVHLVLAKLGLLGKVQGFPRISHAKFDWIWLNLT